VEDETRSIPTLASSVVEEQKGSLAKGSPKQKILPMNRRLEMNQRYPLSPAFAKAMADKEAWTPYAGRGRTSP
jgi:hypothetical protein